MKLKQYLTVNMASLFGLLLALFVSLWMHRHLSSDGEAVAAAQRILPLSGSDDLLLVSSKMGRGSEDRGRILFPFRPRAAISDDAEVIDLHSLPFRRVLVQQGVNLKKWQVDPAQLKALDGVAGWKYLQLSDPDRMLLKLWDSKNISVEAAPIEQDPALAASMNVPHQPVESAALKCLRPSPEGGVSCGPQAWFRVGPSVQKLNGINMMCLWAHPPKDAQRLVIPLYLPETLAAGSKLHVQMNFADSVRHDPHQLPVYLRAEVADVQQEISCTKKQGSCVLDVKLPNNINANKQVGLEIWTQNNGRQLLCLSGGLQDPKAAPRGASAAGSAAGLDTRQKQSAGRSK